MLTLTREEFRALLGDPATFDTLMSHHSVQCDMAHSAGFGGCADWHMRRRVAMVLERDRLQAVVDLGDGDPRPPLESVPLIIEQDAPNITYEVKEAGFGWAPCSVERYTAVRGSLELRRAGWKARRIITVE